MTKHSGREPVAVIGMACRFPGACDVASFWRVLRNGIDATSETPADRYELSALYSATRGPGRVVSRRAGYLPGIDQFDGAFFGMSGAEADYLDPQQRLLMMTAWEALEDAGLPPGQLAGSRSGVYVGASYADYWDLITRQGLGAIDVPAITNFRSLLPGRLSYLFDLRGPSICVDTACSSSLVAVHLACQSIRAGESELALVGGVSLKLVPDRDVLFSRARVLAPDGRCKFGAAGADGAAFSDGVGVVVLKPLDQALADGDRVRAVIAGSAVTNDGASSGSLLAPSVEAHAQMLRWAYQDADVDPSQVDFVEAHGTGTQMIDPVEFAALGAVLGAGRPPDHPCLVGSVKTNIGHAESAAGVAGLIKTVLCLENELVVPSLHFDKPNPAVDWEALPLTVPTAAHPVAGRQRPVIAGVSGQGISSVNAHLVVKQADPGWTTPRSPAAPDRLHLLAMSARTPHALADLARRYLDYLRPGAVGSCYELRDVSFSAAQRRTHHDCRMALIANTPAQAVRQLQEFLAMGTADLGPHSPLRDTAHAYVGHMPVRWADVIEPGARYVPLPTYPWQCRRHWMDVTEPGLTESGVG